MVHCIISAGATYEPLDKVRRLTNSSTGSLGTKLALRLAEDIPSIKISLLRSETATYPIPDIKENINIQTFSTTETLLRKFQDLSTNDPCVIFHIAAVSDFSFGNVYEKLPDGTMERRLSTKFSTRNNNPLFAELIPTPKILEHLRSLFPSAFIVGWKYETTGSKSDLLKKAQEQISHNRSNLCVMNGPAYGNGYGIFSLTNPDKFIHIANYVLLFEELQKLTFH